MLMLLLAVSTTALPGPAGEIQAFHSAYSEARVESPHRVAPLLKSTLTPDFAFLRADGKRVGKTQFIADAQARAVEEKATRFVFRLGTVRRFPEYLQVIVRDDWEAVVKDASGKPTKKAFTHMTAETWVMVGKTPKCQMVREMSAPTPLPAGQKLGEPFGGGGRTRVRVGRVIPPQK